MNDDACAIIGMACIFPGSPNLATYWSNICSGVDAISEAPFERLHPVFFSTGADTPAKLQCRRGGFIQQFAHFDPLRHGVTPESVATAEPDQLLLLDLAAQALQDAGYDHREFPCDRTGVVVGRGNYPGVGRARLDQHVRTAEQLIFALKDLVPGLSAETLERVRREFQAKSGLPALDGVIGLVPNLTASRIANRLNLRGTAFTLDAACASGLVALEHACSQLRQHQADVMLCAAAHLAHTESFWQVFQQLGAISKSGVIRPLAAGADGTLIGEGLGVLVLKRVADALQAGDRIYAAVRGVGCASDGRSSSLMSPSVEGQVQALELAWRAAGLDPNDIGLIEAHGTGTPTGDSVEIETLRRFFGENPAGRERVSIGCVKSMIGHAMPAAGMAGVIKTALALYHGVRPPTLHCAEPHEALGKTRFQPVQQAESWANASRVAGVDAFGFGGINAHAVLQSLPALRASAARGRGAPSIEPPVLLVAGSSAQLLDALDVQPLQRAHGEFRLAMVDVSSATRQQARRIIERGLTSNGRDGVFYARQPLLKTQGKLAFLFAGLDARFEPRVHDVAAFLGEASPVFQTSPTLEAHCAEILRVNMLVFRALGQFGIRPDMLAGHSIGEWTALAAGSVVDERALTEFIAALRPRDSVETSTIQSAAVTCSLATALAEIADLPELDISHDNCPHQVLICGPATALDVACSRFKARGALVQSLPLGRGVHSRHFAAHLKFHAQAAPRFALSKASVPIYSATTAAPIPDSPQPIAELSARLLVERVRFRELVERLYEDGARVFVQVGAGSLVGFVEDILRGRPYACISANVRQRSGLSQLVRTACLIWAHGGEPNVAALGTRAHAPTRAVRLALGLPMVRFDAPLQQAAQDTSVAVGAQAARASALARQPVARLLLENLDLLQRAQLEVVASSGSAHATPAAAPLRRSSRCIDVSVHTLPELVDHAFDRQAAHWPVEETFPVVPMTGLIELMLRGALELASGRRVLEVEDVVATRWLAVGTPVQLAVEIAERQDGRIAVELSGYAAGIITLGSEQPFATPAPPPRTAGNRPAISAAELYGQGWMFHGPSYQVVTRIDSITRDSICGQLVDTGAIGALLDGAGQLLGYWLMATAAEDRLAMPTHVRRIRFHGRRPEIGAAVSCSVTITRVDATVVEGSFHLSSEGVVWATVEGWQSRRFATPGRFFEVLRRPQHAALSEVQMPGLAILTDIYNAATTRDYLARRYLRSDERKQFEALPPGERRAWLNLQIAIKDAARSVAWSRDATPIFPAEVVVASNRQMVSIADRQLQLSTASDHAVWVAYASEAIAQLRIIRVSSPAAEVLNATVSESELRLVPNSGDRNAWRTRIGLVKQAVKELKPDRAQVIDRRDDMLLANGHWYCTLHWGSYVICWNAT